MPAPAPLLCTGCATDLTRPSPPLHSEKQLPPTHYHSCGHAVCPSCQANQRRLVRYCVLCDSAQDVFASGSGSSSSSRAEVGKEFLKGGAQRSNKEGGLPGYAEQHFTTESDFVLGGDSDEEDDAAAPSEAPPPIESPPAYDDEHGTTETEPSDAKRQSEQSQIHYLKPEETLLGLSMAYRVDGPLLCRLNKLPTSTLSTTPHLLHTLPFLLLPPCAASRSATPHLNPIEERRRLVLRRFQVHTRCSEWALAKAYVQPIFDARDAELEQVRANRRARGDTSPVEVREGGELEEAVERYMDDQRWEQAQAGVKGKASVIGSKIKSTGEVEGRIKGWGWR